MNYIYKYEQRNTPPPPGHTVKKYITPESRVHCNGDDLSCLHEGITTNKLIFNYVHVSHMYNILLWYKYYGKLCSSQLYI